VQYGCGTNPGGLEIWPKKGYILDMQKIIRLVALALAALIATPALSASLPEGQNKADYLAWLAKDPGARAEVLSFRSVEAVSGFRNAELNQCSGGAKASAHRHFYALDLIPANEDISRSAMIRDICRVHTQRGDDLGIGLGFYAGNRFHVDSKGFRRWGADGRGATSPCVTGIA
jgi:hypothetical protein